MIGILYSKTMLLHLIKGKRSFEKPSFYVETTREIGEEIIFLSLSDINWSKGTVRGWNGVDPIIIRRSLPDVIINRTRTNHPHTKMLIQRLKRMGKIVLNEQNVISKLEIHHILTKNNKLVPYLPETDSVTHHSVRDLLEHNTSLFLKPSTASVGNGIIRIRKINNKTVAEINILGRTKMYRVGINQIITMVKRKKRDYLVQGGVSLMKYNGNPVDFRVSMQKNGKGRWQYTGMVGRVAKKGSIVTNLHCGGQSLKATKLFEHWGWNSARIEGAVAKLGLRIAKTLEKEFPNIADLGLDIALDESQHPWIIEVNFRDLRITFRDAGDKETWRSTFKTPIYYAAYLIKQIREQQNTRGLDLNNSDLPDEHDIYRDENATPTETVPELPSVLES
ncbi:YheC/YheD family protein [Paenibacillus crassostreae]|uniref:Endospore coat-associated protein n=1 Tax=Paenibacillus crassostreae TaxID=1763538 RepID=A0A167ECY8_9BACL|nr:YheC/YheD family protein [Paenibacillus crassostreae]AOZ91961.1 hypothetical protein LPB68_06835 [Paenibacillus crassostreae]OAB75408.1 hypothetical protein PNBC_08560 [Paenibacillus crassostreae]